MNELSNHCLIDGDIILYQAGFASQKTQYLVSSKKFDCKKDADEYSRNRDYPVTQLVTPEPIDYCLSTVKRMIGHIMAGCKAKTCEVVLTGADNFRIEVATMQPYKGNRVSPKPVHYEAIRQYLINHWYARVVDGEEADDYLSYTGLSTGSTICTIDKDLNNTSGWHYNWNNKRLYYVDDESASLHFYTQMLVGDATDNIPGLFRLTGTRCSKAMKDELFDMHSDKEMMDYVYSVWDSAIDSELENNLPELTTLLTEIGQLLHMRTYPNEMWTPYEE
mgnify:CR=1 FL=1